MKVILTSYLWIGTFIGTLVSILSVASVCYKFCTQYVALKLRSINVFAVFAWSSSSQVMDKFIGVIQKYSFLSPIMVFVSDYCLFCLWLETIFVSDMFLSPFISDMVFVSDYCLQCLWSETIIVSRWRQKTYWRQKMILWLWITPKNFYPWLEENHTIKKQQKCVCSSVHWYGFVLF
jgi:hypothetical protein